MVSLCSYVFLFEAFFSIENQPAKRLKKERGLPSSLLVKPERSTLGIWVPGPSNP